MNEALNEIAKKYGRYEENELKQELIDKFDISDIEDYSLINNFGFTFKLGDKKFDCRYWANCYGVALNYWQID